MRLVSALLLLVAVVAGPVSKTATPVKQEPIQVVAWGAEWCTWCVKNKPELLRLHKSGKYVIMFIDYDKHKAFARDHGITRLPSYFVIENNFVMFKTGSLKALKAYKPKRK